MLRQLNITLKNACDETETKVGLLKAKDKTANHELTLLERLSLFHGLCGESIKFNEALASLEDWLEKNESHAIYSLTQQVVSHLSLYVTMITTYLEKEKDIQNLEVHFDKGRVMQDTANLHEVSVLIEALNKVLYSDGKNYQQSLLALTKGIEEASPSSCGPLDYLGLFGAKGDANVVKVAELLKPLVAVLNQVQHPSYEQKAIFIFRSMKP